MLFIGAYYIKYKHSTLYHVSTAQRYVQILLGFILEFKMKFWKPLMPHNMNLLLRTDGLHETYIANDDWCFSQSHHVPFCCVIYEEHSTNIVAHLKDSSGQICNMWLWWALYWTRTGLVQLKINTQDADIYSVYVDVIPDLDWWMDGSR